MSRYLCNVIGVTKKLKYKENGKSSVMFFYKEKKYALVAQAV